MRSAQLKSRSSDACGLTPRSRRGPTAIHQARLVRPQKLPPMTHRELNLRTDGWQRSHAKASGHLKSGWLNAIGAALCLFGADFVHTQPQGTVEDALRDFYAGKTLPGIPNLKTPVYLSAGSIICYSPAAQANPNKDVLVSMGECAVTEIRIRVSVRQPRGQEDYMNGHVYRVVEVVWKSAAQSDATVYSGWTATRNLEN